MTKLWTKFIELKVYYCFDSFETSKKRDKVSLRL